MTELQIIKAGMDKLSGTKADDTGLDPERDEKIREMAQKFEASFISQMLKHSGLPKALESSGGQGTDAFTGFYIDQLSTEIAGQGGFGLAESIYAQLKNYEEPK